MNKIIALIVCILFLYGCGGEVQLGEPIEEPLEIQEEEQDLESLKSLRNTSDEVWAPPPPPEPPVIEPDEDDLDLPSEAEQERPLDDTDDTSDVDNTTGVDTTNQTSAAQDSIWQPTPGTSWHWQLDGKLNMGYDVDVYDIDLFDTPKKKINQLHDRGVKVICYFSAGSYEDWRPDADDFPQRILGLPLEDWEGETYVDISRLHLLGPIMEARLDLAQTKGCDGVEPDNVDIYQANNGLGLTGKDQKDYNMWLAAEAHKRGLAIGLKNDLDQVSQLEPYFDFAINEQCFEYEECDLLLSFIRNDKAVFGVEYELRPGKFCDEANSMDLDWLKMDYDLDGGRYSCR